METRSQARTGCGGLGKWAQVIFPGVAYTRQSMGTVDDSSACNPGTVKGSNHPMGFVWAWHDVEHTEPHALEKTTSELRGPQTPGGTTLLSPVWINNERPGDNEDFLADASKQSRHSTCPSLPQNFDAMLGKWRIPNWLRLNGYHSNHNGGS